MDKLVYTAATGLKAHMASQAAIANNMANASTIGFRADKVVFSRLNVSGAEFDTRSPIKLALYGRRAAAKDAGVPPEGTGAHRVVVGGDAGPFTDPDGFVWETAPRGDT